MLKQTLFITLNYLTTTYRYRSTLIFALLMPLVFTLVLGNITGSAQGDSGSRWSVGVADEDGAALSQALLSRLAAGPELTVRMMDRNAALSAVRREDLDAALVIPAGFTEAARGGRPVELTLTVGGNDPQTQQVISLAVDAALSGVQGIARAAQIAAAAGAVSPASGRASLLSAAQATRTGAETDGFAASVARSQALWSGARPVTVSTQAVAATVASPIPDGFNQSSPGMLVTFGLVLMLSGATVLVAEREQGTLRRLLVLPLGKAGILTGKLSGIWAAGLAQAAVLIAAGALAFHVNWGRSPAALVVMVLAFGFSIASLGMLLAALSRTYAQANALVNILMYSIAALGGAWWPSEIMPGWMQGVAKAVPTYWAMQGFSNIITRGLGLQAVLPQAAALVAFGGLFLVVGVRRFRYE